MLWIFIYPELDLDNSGYDSDPAALPLALTFSGEASLVNVASEGGSLSRLTQQFISELSQLFLSKKHTS